MSQVSTTRMSSKGRVVIPEEIRKRLRLEAGAQFLVMAEDDAVVLKEIPVPSMDEFDGLLSEARRQARNAGMKPADLKAAIKDVRGGR